MKHLAILIPLIPLILTACADTAPPPDPPPPTTTADPTTTVAEDLDGPAPEDYITLERAPDISDELTAALQENSWAGWRDPLYVADKCSWALKPNVKALFPMTHGELQDFGARGAGFDREGLGFLERLRTVNKRCDSSHPEHDSRFCGRSDVQRSRLSEYRVRLTEHLEAARDLRDGLKGQPGYGEAWNSIKGWCENQQ